MSKATRDRHHGHQPTAAPSGAWWNNISRRWFTEGEEAPVELDPQPPPPVDLGAGQALRGHVPPAVKVAL